MTTRADSSMPGSCSGRGGLQICVRLVVAVATIGFAQQIEAAEPARAGRPPNVVIFVADDLGLTLGCYGDRVARTPHLDRLASEGVRFTHAFCTTASCSPSRSVILTGRHNHSTGQYGLEHDVHHFRSFEAQRTLPLALGQSGYRTARAGKFHVAPPGTYRFQTTIPGNARKSAQLADECRTWLSEKSDAPFFLFFCTADPHRSGGLEARPGAVDRFGNPDPNNDAEKWDPAAVPVPAFLPDTVACRAELAEYYRSVARMDEGFGRLRAVLDECGHADNTLIMALSDNGIAFPGAKTTLYEPGIRLPLIVKAPGAGARGAVSDAMISWVDLAPTVFDYAQLTNQPPVHGRSFREIVEGGRPAGWDEVFASHSFHEVTMYYPMRALRNRRYKLIHNLASPLAFPFASDLWSSAVWQETLTTQAERYGRRPVRDFLHRPEWELYDLEKDPHEISNLAAASTPPAVLEEMQEKLREFRIATGDPWTVKYQHE